MFTSLKLFLEKIPAVISPVSTFLDAHAWTVQFQIDISHDLAWKCIQELSYVINNLSLTEILPVIFYPTSPPPYLNGGPSEYLQWIIESKDPEFTPELLKTWLEARLPDPIDDAEKWTD